MKLLNIVTTASLCLIMAACGNGNQPTDRVDSAKKLNDSMISRKDSLNKEGDTARATSTGTPLGKDDAEFAVKAADGNLAEVAMGQLAVQKAVNPRLKAFGQMMIDDHSAARRQLADLGQKKNIALPVQLSDKQTKHADDLGKKNGAEFDKAYTSMMLDDHKSDISEFEKAAKNCQDADLKSYASATLPVLHKHLDSLRAISGKK